MTTTVTVDDDVRRKLKKLAAVLDVTQGEVIERALRLYEDQVLHRESRSKTARKVLDALTEASSKVRRSDPEWARVSRTIENAARSIEEFAGARWGKEF